MLQMKRSYQFSKAFRRKRIKDLLVSGSLNPVYDTMDVESPSQGSSASSGQRALNEHGTDSQYVPTPESLWDKELHIQVVRARSLLAMDINGYSDPYCIIKVGGISHRTSIVKKSLKPSWNEVFIIYPLELGKTNGCAKFEVWDADQWTADDFLGQVKFNFYQFPNANAENKKRVTLQLVGSQSLFKELGLLHSEEGTCSRGSLTLSFWWTQTSASGVSRPEAIGGTCSIDDPRCISSLCRLQGQNTSVPSVHTTRMGSLYEQPAAVYICLQLKDIEICTDEDATQAVSKSCAKPSTVGKIIEKAKGRARSFLPSFGSMISDRLTEYFSETRVASDEPIDELPVSGFLEEWAEDLTPSIPGSPRSDMNYSDADDDVHNETGMESIPEFELGQAQSPEDILRENSYWRYKIDYLKQCYASEAIQNEEQGQVQLNFRDQSLFVAFKPLENTNVVIRLYNSSSPLSRWRRVLILKWTICLFDLLAEEQTTFEATNGSGIKGRISIFHRIINPDVRSCLYRMPLRRYTTEEIDIALSSSQSSAHVPQLAQQGILNQSSTTSGELMEIIDPGQDAKPTMSVGEFMIEIDKLELEDPVDCFCVMKCGPHWCKTTTMSAAKQCHWAWEIHVPIYEPSTLLIFTVFHEHRRQFVMQGKLRLRLSTLEPNQLYNCRLPIACEGCVTGYVTLKMHAQYPSWMLLGASYFAPPMDKYISGCEVNLSRFQKIIKRESNVLLIRWLDKNASRIPASVSLKVLDQSCDSFSVGRLRIHVQRIRLCLSQLKPIFVWVEYIRAWKSPVVSAGVALAICLFVFYPNKTFFLLMFAVGMLCILMFKLSNTVPTMADPPLIPEAVLEESSRPKETPNPYQILKAKYDKMQSILIRVQNGLDTLASCLETVEALVAWKDPVASRIFVAILFIGAIAIKLFGIQTLACCGILWLLRPPWMRNSKPSRLVNFLARIPTRGDQVL